MLHHLLTDLNDQDGIERCHIVVTLNLANEPLDVTVYPNLKITVLRNPVPKGFGANHNAAFSYCDSPWFIVLNPDIRLPEYRTVLKLTSQPAVTTGLLAPIVINSAGTVEDSVRQNLSPWSLLGRAFGLRKRNLPDGTAYRGRPFYWLAGMCLVVNTDAFRHIGGFDERYFLYCEDYDLSARLYLAGYSIGVASEVSVIHDAQRDSHRSFRHLRWHIESLVRVWLSMPFWLVMLARLWR